MFLLKANVAGNRIVFDARESFQHCLKNNFGTRAGHRHSDLATNAFFGAGEDKIVGEGLQPCAFAIGQSARLGVVVNVRAAAARTRHGVRGLVGVEASIDTAERRRLHVQLNFGRQVGVEGILSRLNKFQSFDDGGLLLGQFVIGGVRRYRRIF